MRIVITGATGLIGSALASKLVSTGHEVLGVSRTSAPGTILWDVENRILDVSALEGIDAIVHLAGEPIDGRWTKAKRRRIRDSRIASTHLLCQAIASLPEPPHTFLSGSAIGYYGDTGGRTVTEDDSHGDDFMAQLCVDWEAAARAAADRTRVVMLRTGMVLADSGGALRPLTLATKMFVGGPMGNGRQTWSWITIEDEVRAIIHLLEADLEGPVNLTAPSPVSQREFMKALGRVLHRPTIVPAPRFGLRLILGELADSLILTSADVRPGVLEASGFSFLHGTIGPALEAVLAP